MAFPTEILVPGNPLSNADLTTKNVGGDGTFDVIMSSVYNHLGKEYENGRITGQEYTKAYIALTTAALSSAVQYLLQKDTTYWQKILLQQQVDGILLDNEIKKYNLNTLLPAQKKLVDEQVEVQRAQTLDVRTDGQNVTGSVGKQKDLYSQQITSYKRDAEVKAAKLFTDAWITQKTIDEGLLAPNGFTNASLDTILTALKVNNQLT